jgi:hypothetical protein
VGQFDVARPAAYAEVVVHRRARIGWRLSTVVGGLSLSLASALKGPEWLWDISLAAFLGGFLVALIEPHLKRGHRAPTGSIE